MLGSFNAGASAMQRGDRGSALEVAAFVVLALMLVYGSTVYQVARLGFLRRLRQHAAAPLHRDEAIHDDSARHVTILVPAYQEQPRVVRQTLFSAALQPYPSANVVLLIDDRPNPGSSTDRELLEGSRQLPDALNTLFYEPRARIEVAYSAFASRSGSRELSEEAHELADLVDLTAGWFEDVASREPVIDHTDVLFVRDMLRAPAADLRARARTLREAVRLASVDAASIERFYQRLRSLFSTRITAFERKRYVNLSQEPNKAMNLNSYLSLAGGKWREVQHEDGLHLERVTDDSLDGGVLEVPDPEFVLTLDADSLLLPEYLPRLVSILNDPGNGRVAVAQTPYSAVPGATSALERVAGATTDIQYVIHQGYTHHNATFWVGANALIRKQALDDIVKEEIERGYPVRRYIQDRTVIEDTESSVDLVRRGWTLFNHPERLTYSATPPDFGALVIQRRRWANGGLIILPKLLSYVRARLSRDRRLLGEAFMRAHYLISIAVTSIALLLMLAYPFGNEVATIWLPLTALPYAVLYWRDLRHAGYRHGDVIRVYALNLLLLPVNLGGVAKSLHQLWTGRRIPFGRTPKIEDRTRTPWLYLLAPIALILFLSMGAASDAVAGRTVHAVFAAVNALLLGYAVSVFIGWPELIADLRAQLPLRWPETLRSPGRS